MWEIYERKMRFLAAWSPVASVSSRKDTLEALRSLAIESFYKFNTPDAVGGIEFIAVGHGASLVARVEHSIYTPPHARLFVNFDWATGDVICPGDKVFDYVQVTDF